jgi:hypothetical protein
MITGAFIGDENLNPSIGKTEVRLIPLETT